MKSATAAGGVLVFFSLGCGLSGTDEEKIRLQVQIEDQAQTITDLQAKLATCDCPEPVVAAPEPDHAAATPAAAPDPGDSSLPGEIEVKATTAVQVLIDGKVLVYNPLKSGYVKRDLTPGPHLIEVETPGIRQVNWSDTVQVIGGKRLRFQHKLGQKGLTQLGTVDAKGND